MSTIDDPVRESFVARFGEEEAVKIEDAAQSHYASDAAASLDMLFPSPHGNDNFGSSPFRYWFLLAIGSECVTRFSGDHGIAVAEQELRDWALHDGKLGEHDGDVPDYLGLIVGAYEGWIDVPAGGAS